MFQMGWNHQPDMFQLGWNQVPSFRNQSAISKVHFVSENLAHVQGQWLLSLEWDPFRMVRMVELKKKNQEKTMNNIIPFIAWKEHFAGSKTSDHFRNKNHSNLKLECWD